MVEIANAVAAQVAEYLVAPIARPFGYIWNYKTNFDNLKTEVQKLEGQRDMVQHSVDEARRNGEQIEKHVNDWLDRVHTITEEVSKVIEDNERADMKCFKGLCPNPKKRYQHSRQAVKKTQAVAGLYDEGNFPTVSFRTIPKETWIPSYKGYMVFESRISTLKNILDALSNPDVNIVGIYGTGGIGKTTLAKEIAQHAEDKKLFNVVAFAEVAVKPDIKEIQQEIADKLGLTFREESISGRARSLRQRLKQEEKVLLVLDNIWDKLDLEVVGIPFGNDGEGCKLLLTARILDVLLEMESQNNFEVGILDKGEAWSLFEKKAGVCDHLQALAKEVASACGGLPIAIDSVAVALKNKKECEWKDALRKLTVPSASNFEGVSATTYSCLEISYIQLEEKELKSTFLLCCMMENTYIEDLLAYGKGMGIFEDVNTMEDARNRVNTLLRKLKDSSLLLDINDYQFSLHDVVRYIGTSIASRDRNMFRNCTIRELVDKDALKNCLAITLHNISELPKEFKCPELQFFYMRTTVVGNYQFPDKFFIGMPKLKVLHLVGFDLNSMPNSIGFLVNLRTLCIDDCKLRDIDFIREIKQLEIFRIRGHYRNEIQMLSVCNLTGLRLLDLDDCIRSRNIPPNVLSTFTQLEELYLPVMEWEVKGVNILDELKHLTHLTALKISIPRTDVLPKGQLLSNKLERYSITFGGYVWSEFYWLHKTSRRTVKLNLESSSCSDDVQKFLSVLDTEGFPELEYLWVENSPCFQTVVDCLESESCHNHFLFLEWLNLHSVFNLERIHNHQLRAESFQRLTTLEVVKCNKLKNIFSFSIYKALPSLLQVHVSSCDNMEEIFAINRREEGINNDEGTDQIEFKQLRSLILNSLPKLTSFCSINGNKDMLDQIEFKQLHFLSLVSLPKLTNFCSINGNKDILDTPTPLFNQKDSVCNLQSLTVKKCNKLSTIFQSNMLEQNTKLESLTVAACELVEEIFDLQGVDFEKSHLEIETLLRNLDINGLPNLKHIWNKDPQKMFSYQKLNSVKVHHCMNLKYLFPVSIAESLSELQHLDLCFCGVEEIVGDGQGETNVAATFVFPHITSLELKFLPQLKTFYRGVHTSQWQNLKRLFMFGCDKVELFASELFNFQENNEGQHDSSVQPLFMVEKVTFPNLEEIKISQSSNLKMVWHKQAKESFCNLKSMQVRDCYSLLTIFQFSMPRLLTVGVSGCALLEENFDLQKVNFEELYIRGLPKLKHIWKKDSQAKLSFEELPMPKSLQVLDCDSIEEVFDLRQKVNFEESHSRPVTNQLKKLYISGLPKLKHIWKKDPQAKLSFQELPMLESLTVSNCDSIEEIFDLQKVNFEDSHSRAVMYHQLKELFISGLPKLKHIWKKDPQEKLSFEELPMPKSLTVRCCDSIEEIFDLQKVNFEESHSRPVMYHQLQQLDINQLPKLKHIWNKDPQAELFFKSLQKVDVYNCQNLKDVFPASIGRSLLQLVRLNVYNCGKLEEVVAREGEAKAAVRFVYPELTSIGLNELPQLRTFYPGVHSLKCLVLKELEVVGCDKMELLASELFSFQENNEESHLEIPAQQPLFLVEKVQDEESVVFPLCILLRVRHLQKLCLESCSYKEIFSYQEDETHVWIDSKLDTVLQKLESLGVEGCHNLIQVVSSSVSFQNLTILMVWDGNGLKNLMTSSTAKSLVQLREMEIQYCDSMIEVVTKEGDVTAEDEITFSNLRILILRSLPSLSCFCSENCTFELPSLKKLALYGCPEMKCFSSRDVVVTTPILQIAKERYGRVYKLKGDLNTTIQQIQEHSSSAESSSYKEIFSYEDDETDVENLIKLVPSSVAMD